MFLRHYLLTALFLVSGRQITSAQQSDVVHMGITLPLSGPAAAYGRAAMNGFEMARELSPQHFSRLEFHYEDTQIRPALAVTAFAALNRNFSTAIHFDFGSVTSLALAPLAEQRKQLLVSSAYDPHVNSGRSHVIRFANSTSDYVESLLRVLRSKGLRRFAVLSSTNPFFLDYAETFRLALRQGEELYLAQVSGEEMDFNSVVTKMLSQSPPVDAIGVFMFTEQSIQFLRKIRTSPWKGQLFGTDAFEELVGSTTPAQILQDLVFPNARVDSTFSRKYSERFGTTAHVTFAASTFDFANLLSQAVARCTSCTSEELQLLLEAPTIHSGALGRFSFVSSVSAGKHFASIIVIKTFDGTSLLEVLPQSD